MSHLRLSFKQKLLLGILLSIVVVFGAGGLTANWLIQRQLLDQACRQMEVTSQGIHDMVRSLVATAIKNYLKGIAETNLAYVKQVYARFQTGEISEQRAKELAEAFMLKQKIGSTGYITAVDVSNGGIKLAVHPYYKGRDLRLFPFARQQARQKTGYMEFEWQNPSDRSVRTKAMWMCYFEPWQWIINAAPFRDEYAQLVDLAGIEPALGKVEKQVKGYIFIMDMQGTLLSHPTWKGRNMLATTDAETGAPFTRQIIDAIRRAQEQKLPEGQAGIHRYHVRDSQTGQVYERIMNYRYVPELDFVVGVVTDLDQLAAPLKVVRNSLLAVMAGSLLLSLLVVIYAVRPLTRSIDDLAAAVEQIDGGSLDTPLPPSGSDEIGRLALAFRSMTKRLVVYTNDLETQVRERTQALEASRRMFETISLTDGLTGIANRRRFDAALIQECARHARSGAALSLILLDIDHFKAYNDNLGHVSGDDCLRQAAGFLATSLTRPADLAARYGGEEFACILPETGHLGAIAVAEKIRLGIMDLAIPHPSSPSADCITASFGVATMTCNDDTKAAEIVELADRMLYQAKALGRNRVESAVAAGSREHALVQLAWKEGFRSGNALIDTQHQKLLRHANDLLEALFAARPGDELSALATALVDDIARHFGDEERILESVNFPGLEQHRQEHARLRDRGRILARELAAGAATGDICIFLIYDVVFKHMVGADREFFPFTGVSNDLPHSPSQAPGAGSSVPPRA